MLCRMGINLKSSFMGIFIGILALLITACDDNSTNSNGNTSNGVNTIEGSIEGYDLGAQELYESEDFVDLIDGEIESDGSFRVEFLGEDVIEEALQPLSEDTDGFVAMYCREEIQQDLSNSQQFVDVARFNFTYGENNDVGIIGYSSMIPNINVYPPQSDTDGEYQVRWIYSNEEISISKTCDSGSTGTNEVEVDLSKGWNEIIFDLSDEQNKRMYTGDIPSEVSWVLET